MAVILGGNTGIYLASSGGPTPPVLDPDATAFLTAAGITDPIISSAINTLVVDLKGYGIWTKMHAIYPFVGGTASTHKWNLKNPLDTNAAFRLVFYGGWTHSANGIQCNGTNTYADTFYIQNLHLPSQDNLHISVYSRSNISEANVSEMAVRDQIGTTTRTYIIFGRSLTTSFYVATNNTFQSFADTNSLGHMIATRTASNFYAAYRNGLLASSSTVASIRRANYSLYIGVANLENIPQAGSFTAKQLAFSSIGLGLSGADSLNFYNAIQAFQTTLGRNV